MTDDIRGDVLETVLRDSRAGDAEAVVLRLAEFDGDPSSFRAAGPVLLRVAMEVVEDALLAGDDPNSPLATTDAIAAATVAFWSQSIRVDPEAVSASFLSAFESELRSEMPINMFCYFAVLGIGAMTREWNSERFDEVLRAAR